MDDVTIANLALARIGGIQIQSFAVPGPSGPIVKQTYDSVLEDILGKYPWHFTKKRGALQPLTEAPSFGWSRQFKLPADRLAPPRAIYNSPSTDHPFHDWEPQGDTILSNAEALYAVYQWRPHPSWWPVYVRELIILAVAAELAGAVREDWSLRKMLRLECYGDERMQGMGGQFAVATGLDAQAQPAPEIDGGRNPLIDVRYSPGDARSGWEEF